MKKPPDLPCSTSPLSFKLPSIVLPDVPDSLDFSSDIPLARFLWKSRGSHHRRFASLLNPLCTLTFRYTSSIYATVILILEPFTSTLLLQDHYNPSFSCLPNNDSSANSLLLISPTVFNPRWSSRLKEIFVNYGVHQGVFLSLFYFLQNKFMLFGFQICVSRVYLSNNLIWSLFISTCLFEIWSCFSIISVKIYSCMYSLLLQCLICMIVCTNQSFSKNNRSKGSSSICSLLLTCLICLIACINLPFSKNERSYWFSNQNNYFLFRLLVNFQRLDWFNQSIWDKLYKGDYWFYYVCFPFAINGMADLCCICWQVLWLWRLLTLAFKHLIGHIQEFTIYFVSRGFCKIVGHSAIIKSYDGCLLVIIALTGSILALSPPSVLFVCHVNCYPHPFALSYSVNCHVITNLRILCNFQGDLLDRYFITLFVSSQVSLLINPSRICYTLFAGNVQFVTFSVKSFMRVSYSLFCTPRLSPRNIIL